MGKRDEKKGFSEKKEIKTMEQPDCWGGLRTQMALFLSTLQNILLKFITLQQFEMNYFFTIFLTVLKFATL